MKIAITSKGNTLDSTIDERFGRCAYFAIYNTESQTTEFIENPNKDGQGGVGPASVQFVTSHNICKVISGEFGIKVKPLFDNLKVQMVVMKEHDKKIKDIIETLNH